MSQKSQVANHPDIEDLPDSGENSESVEEDEEKSNEDFSVTDRIRNFLDNVQSRLNQEDLNDSRKDVDLEYNFANPALPTDQEIVDQAIDEMVIERQDEIALREGITDEEIIRRRKVEFDFTSNSSYRNTVINFGLALEYIYPDLITVVEERNKEEDVNPIMDDTPPTMTRLIAKNVGQYSNVTIFFGGRNIIYNVAEQLGLTNDERELVQKCHNIAAKKNNLHKYTLRDDVIIVDQLLSEKKEN